MLDKDSIVKYLRQSLVLKDAEVEYDEAFKFTDEDLWNIVQLVTPNHNPSYTVENCPENEKYFIILLARREVYHRLATASAPFYPLQAEGAELRKDYRFNHYMRLIREVEIEYSRLWSHFDSSRSLEVGDVILQSKHFTTRNYNLASKPTVELSIDVVRESSIDISWSKFNVPSGMFDSYEIYLSNEPIYDEYEDVISKQAKKVANVKDIHRTKFRLKYLTPDTLYYVAVVSKDLNGLKGISEEEISTLSKEG